MKTFTDNKAREIMKGLNYNGYTFWTGNDNNGNSLVRFKHNGGRAKSIQVIGSRYFTEIRRALSNAYTEAGCIFRGKETELSKYIEELYFLIVDTDEVNADRFKRGLSYDQAQLDNTLVTRPELAI